MASAEIRPLCLFSVYTDVMRVDLPLNDVEAQSAVAAADAAGLCVDDWIARLVRQNLNPMPLCATGEQVAIEFLVEHGGSAPASEVLDALEQAGLSRRNGRRVQAISDHIECDGRGSREWRLVNEAL